MAYLEFLEIKDTGKTKVFSIKSKHGYVLGFISWYSGWRRYIFKPSNETIFDVKCLEEIILFINELMTNRKNNGTN